MREKPIQVRRRLMDVASQMRELSDQTTDRYYDLHESMTPDSNKVDCDRHTALNKMSIDLEYVARSLDIQHNLLNGAFCKIISVLRKYIVSDSQILSGTPVFRNTRIPVRDIVWIRRNGTPDEEIIENYPGMFRCLPEELRRNSEEELARILFDLVSDYSMLMEWFFPKQLKEEFSDGS